MEDRLVHKTTRPTKTAKGTTAKTAGSGTRSANTRRLAEPLSKRDTQTAEHLDLEREAAAEAVAVDEDAVEGDVAVANHKAAEAEPGRRPVAVEAVPVLALFAITVTRRGTSGPTART